MKFGVTVPNNFGVDDPQAVLEVGLLAERLGFDSVWVMDHLFTVGFVKERLGDKPYYHLLATLSHLSAITQRVQLGTSVLVLPYHDPVEIAKYAATLDQMSGGRVILGVGAGELEEEFEALGVPYRERGSRTNESMAIMKTLWTEHDPSYSGRHWNFSNVKFGPMPLRQPHIPLWVGGTSPGALRRAGTLGDGWHPPEMDGDPDAFAAGCETIRGIAKQAGRDPDALTMSVRIEVEVGPAGSAHAVDHLIPQIQAYEQAGAEHVVLALGSGDVVAISELMRVIARDVIGTG